MFVFPCGNDYKNAVGPFGWTVFFVSENLRSSKKFQDVSLKSRVLLVPNLNITTPPNIRLKQSKRDSRLGFSCIEMIVIFFMSVRHMHEGNIEKM